MSNVKDEWKYLAVKLANNTNFSWRNIANVLKTPKSTVSDYLRSYFKVKNAGDDDTFIGKQVIPKTAKILLFDIETAPTAAYVWSRWDQNIQQDKVISEGYILTYAAKWLGSDTVISNRITEKEDDSQLVRELADLVNQADIIIAHNIKFDLGWLKTRLLMAGGKPLLPHKLVDTLRIARQEFRFPSNKLGDIATYLGLDSKADTGGFKTWVGCVNMDEAAFDTMLHYNRKDVFVLEEIYLRLRAWSKNHPNVGIYEEAGKSYCVCCGSEDLVNANKSSYTNVSEFEAFTCNGCGKVNRKRVNISEHSKDVGMVNG